MNKENFWSKPFVLPAFVLSFGLVLAVIIGVLILDNRSSADVISVTGSTKARVIGDSVKWSFTISRRVPAEQTSQGYASLARDLILVKQFLKDNSVMDNEISITPVFMNEVYKSSYDSGPREVNLSQTITVQSTKVSTVTDMAKKTEVLVRNGIILSTQQPQYYYSKLADLRVSLLSDAIKDAKARAVQIAKSSGQSIGKLKSASSGVVQVLAPDSTEIDGYGSYDVYSIEKDVMITVRATFGVR
jgi:hypothetical protein